jgi:septal ring factor EnvC (AmiA/AmiB activator)
MDTPADTMFDRYPSPSSPSASPNNHNTDWKAKYYAVEEMLNETRNELDEFQQSSKELEEELERELERTEKAQEELKKRIAKLDNEKEEWKVCP